MTTFQAWKLYGRYVLRHTGRRIASLLRRVLPGVAKTKGKRRAKKPSSIATSP